MTSLARGGASVAALGGLNPLLVVAASFLPEILRVVSGDRGGPVAEAAAKAVVETTGTQDPVAARQALATDPAAQAALQMKLAQLTAEQDEARQKAQMEAIRAELRAENERVERQIKDVQDARERASEWARAGGPMAFGPIVISILVVLGFFGILATLIALMWSEIRLNDNNIYQLITVTVGALAAAFATVVSFWLGSSQGSRLKDVTNASVQYRTAETNRELAKSQAETSRQPPPAPVAPVVVSQPGASAQKPSNFQRCVDLVLLKEGGYVNDPNDLGGATNRGITLATFRDWRDDPALDPADLQNLSKSEACDIYRTRYWNVLRCDDLPTGIDLMVFDHGVNAGPGRAAKMLQKIVGAEADGSVGPATVAATKAADPRAVIRRMSEDRLEFYRSRPGWPRYGNGWTNRVRSIEEAALGMLGG